MMHLLKYILILFMFSSCTSRVFEADIPLWLNLSDVEILNSQTFYEIGWAGEGVILEIYTLSPKTISDFQSKKDLILPDKEKWSKINWENGYKSPVFKEIEFVFSYQGENNNIEKYSQIMKSLLFRHDTYVALYYTGKGIKVTSSFLVLLLNPTENRLYILDFAI